MSDVRQFIHRPSPALRRHGREILWVRSEHSRDQLLLRETTLTLLLQHSGARVDLSSPNAANPNPQPAKPEALSSKTTQEETQ
jgi:hypothetical protein